MAFAACNSEESKDLAVEYWASIVGSHRVVTGRLLLWNMALKRNTGLIMEDSGRIAKAVLIARSLYVKDTNIVSELRFAKRKRNPPAKGLGEHGECGCHIVSDNVMEDHIKMRAL